MDPENLLLAEYKSFSESLRKNEEVGERRVNFFITLVTAVIAALVVLWSKNGTPDQTLSDGDLVHITTAAWGGLLLFGVVTFLRILQRDYVTDEYKKIIDSLRTRLQLHSDIAYDLPFRKSRFWLIKGSLASTVAIMNSVIAALLCWQVWSSHSLSHTWASVTVGFGITVFLHLPWIALRGKDSFQLSKYFRAGRSKGSSQPSERFRAGVGVVIYKPGGLVLAFERSDRPGSWQFPQGGLDPGETLEQALFREIQEETGLAREHFGEPFEAPIWLGYELPKNTRSEKTGRGQVHRWFFMRFVGDEAAIRLGADGEFKNWDWFHLPQLVDSVVEFRRPVYKQLARIAEREVWPSIIANHS